MTIATLTPAEAQAQIAQGARLIDIRDADEYAREHIPDAELVPLATLTSGAPLNARAGETVIFHCQAGSRTQNNAIRLAAAAAPAQACLLAGGIQAWKKHSSNESCHTASKQNSLLSAPCLWIKMPSPLQEKSSVVMIFIRRHME